MHPWDGAIPCHPIDGAGIVYVEVPKAGCTSIKLALSGLKGGPPEPDEDIHHWWSYTWATDLAELYRWFDTRWRTYFKFTVVREPVARFESFYYGKVGQYAINSYVHALRMTQLDVHAVPQASLLGPELDRFSFIGRTEQMDVVGTVLSAVAGQVITVPHANRSEPERRPLTPKARARLLEVYHADIAMLERLEAS